MNIYLPPPRRVPIHILDMGNGEKVEIFISNREWEQFLENLVSRIGGSTGPSNTELQVDITTLQDENEAVVVRRGMLDTLNRRIAALEDEVRTTR